MLFQHAIISPVRTQKLRRDRYMKKWASLLLVILAFYLFAAPAFADQAIWVSQETAQQAVAILEKEKFKFLFLSTNEVSL